MLMRAHKVLEGANFRRKFGWLRRRAARGGKFSAKIRAALAALLLASPAAAFQSHGVLDIQTLELCLTVPADPAGLDQALRRLQWDEMAPDALSDLAKSGLALAALADRPGAEPPDTGWQAAWDSALAAPPDLARRVFVSPAGSVLGLDYAAGDRAIGLSCTMAMVPADMARTLAGVADALGVALSDLPVFKNMPGAEDEDDEASRAFTLTLVDNAELAGEIDADPPFAGVITTQLQTKPTAP